MQSAERMTKIPAFHLPNGISFRGDLVSESLEYLDTNKPAYELSVGSLTHADQSALYLLGLFAKMGVDTGAPEEAKQAALQHYETVHANRGRGNWNFDGVNYDIEPEDKKGGLFLPKGYEIVGWIKRPVFEKNSGVYSPIVGEGSELIFTEMPPNGYGPVLTVAGLRHPKTGWALATVPTRKEAEERLARDLFSKFVDEHEAIELAKKEVSYSCRKPHGSGNASVYRVYGLAVDGPFSEDARWGADDWGRDLGAFSSNSPEPAGILIMPQDNLYGELCFYENLLEAFRKAAKGKSGKWYVIEFRKDLKNRLLRLKRN